MAFLRIAATALPQPGEGSPDIPASCCGLQRPLTVATTLSVGDAVLFELVLSFLGLVSSHRCRVGEHAAEKAQELITAAPLLALYLG